MRDPHALSPTLQLVAWPGRRQGFGDRVWVDVDVDVDVCASVSVCAHARPPGLPATLGSKQTGRPLPPAAVGRARIAPPGPCDHHRPQTCPQVRASPSLQPSPHQPSAILHPSIHPLHPPLYLAAVHTYIHYLPPPTHPPTHTSTHNYLHTTYPSLVPCMHALATLLPLPLLLLPPPSQHSPRPRCICLKPSTPSDLCITRTLAPTLVPPSRLQ